MLEATILNAFVDVIWVGYMWVSGNVFFFLYLYSGYIVRLSL